VDAQPITNITKKLNVSPCVIEIFGTAWTKTPRRNVDINLNQNTEMFHCILYQTPSYDVIK